jgi:dihydropteroate synthase
MFTLNCQGTLFVLEEPKIMGILNITPDSFFGGSRFAKAANAVQAARQMVQDGAAILDIGGQSTRPNSERLTAQQECERVLPVIEAIRQALPQQLISVDTYHASVAEKAIAAGANIVNDVSAGNMDENMLPTVAKLGCPYVCMHMQGTPASMQAAPQYDDVVKTVLDFFIAKLDACKKMGIKDVVIDPGFGFGKTIEHNYTLLRNLGVLGILQVPVLVGISRKSMIYKVLGTNADEALNGTTALHMMALQNGANLLRVHDVRAAKEAVLLWQQYQQKDLL